MQDEKSIAYENGDFWVRNGRNEYTVFRSGITNSVSDSAYAKTPDGLSIAKARCDYLAKRMEQANQICKEALDRDGIVLSVKDVEV